MDKTSEKQIIDLLYLALSIVVPVLVGAIVTLVIYIKNLHKKHEHKIEGFHDKQVEMAEKFINATNNLAISNENLSKTIEGVGETVSRNTLVMNDLYKVVLENKSRNK